MKKLLSLIMLLWSAQAAHGAEDLYSGVLDSLPLNQEVLIQELTLPPGYEGGAHRHDAWVYVYVVEGVVDMQVEGGETQRVSAGQVFVESPDDIHTVMRNPSDAERARFVAFIIKAEGAPVVLPADQGTP